jgi:Coiled-coil domain-containing protein 28
MSSSAASAFADRELRRVTDAFDCGALSAFGGPDAESRALMRFQIVRKEQAKLSMKQVQLLNDTTPDFRQAVATPAPREGSHLAEDLDLLQAATDDLGSLISESDKALSVITSQLGSICDHIEEVHSGVFRDHQ